MADSPEETPKPQPAGLPNWAIFLIVFIVLGVIAAAAFYMYKKRAGGMNLPAAPPGPNAGAMPGPTNAGLNSGVAAPAAPRLNANRV